MKLLKTAGLILLVAIAAVCFFFYPILLVAQ